MNLERDRALVDTWMELGDHDERVEALVRHLLQLEPAGYRSFLANLETMRDGEREKKQRLEDGEDRQWGGFMEDQMAYRWATLRFGRDPRFERRLREHQRVIDFIEWVAVAADKLWQARLKAEAAQAEAAPPAPPPGQVLEAVRAFIRTGQYRGGHEQMQRDMMVLCQDEGRAAEAKEVMDLLRAEGALNGSAVLRADDFYRPGKTPFRLRWSLTVPLPVPFEELDHATQYNVLFTEWTICQTKAAHLLHNGTPEDARKAFLECLERAKQLGVGELIARSHEGLASAAAGMSQRSKERDHLKAAEAARASR